MAFHMPTAQVQRQRPRVSTPSTQVDSYFNVQASPALEESQEWVLFSPNPPSVTTRTVSASTIHTQRTTVSRFSDFGSLNTRAASLSNAEEEEEVYSPYPGEEEELESLDSHLPTFHEPTSAVPVLPQHDGLGLFPASSDNVQEHIFQFEQFNPKRLSMHTATFPTEESETFKRIHSWRLEQSQALLDEVERETRRRRLSRATSSEKTQSVIDEETDDATLGVSHIESNSTAADSDATATEETESFWKRITRRVIRNLIGIDENILSVIFGESLPVEAETEKQDDILEQLPEDVQDLSNVQTWEERLLQRIAIELGTLVSTLTEHPGAFSTYLRAHQQPEYVGMTKSTPSTVQRPLAKRRLSARDLRSDARSSNGLEVPSTFRPTLRGRSFDDLNLASRKQELWGINEGDEGLPEDYSDEAHSDQTESVRLKRQREHWERELDVKLVFGYFRNRLTNGGDQTPSPAPNTTLATTTTQRSAARAAAIRHHHPLAARTAPRSHLSRTWYHHHAYRRPSSPLTVSGSNSNIQAPASLRRNGSSCASISTRVSGRRGSGSSRNYWDLGGSSGSARGSAVLTGNGWGDV